MPSTRLLNKDSTQNAFDVLRIVLLLGPLPANEIRNVCLFLGLLFSWLWLIVLLNTVKGAHRARLVQALHYKVEGRRFDSRLCHGSLH